MDGLLADIDAYADCAVLPLDVAFMLLHRAPRDTQRVFKRVGQDDADCTKYYEDIVGGR